MIITITIDIPEKEYKEAIADGWKERFQEEISPEEIQNLTVVSDFQSAIPYLDLDDDNTEIEITEQ